MTYGQQKAADIAIAIELVIRDARQVGQELGDSSFARTVIALEQARDLMRSRAGLGPVPTLPR